MAGPAPPSSLSRGRPPPARHTPTASRSTRWLQLLLEEQLHAATEHGVRLVQDLAIGADPDGADAWLWQDLLADGISVGAPPDDFAPDGQRWGLPPFIPWRLRDAGYRPLAELLRSSLVAGGGLRVDHVMGLARLFWIPDGAPPADGAYVRFAGRELLEVLALESVRAQAIVVGEDLGTVEAGFREELVRTGILSTRLVWFEDDPPEAYPRQALGMVTTHDLPDAGRRVDGRGRSGARGARPSDAPRGGGGGAPTARRARPRCRRAAGGGRGRGAPPAGSEPGGARPGHPRGRHRRARRPNVPGTTQERPNWSISLPVAVDDLPLTPPLGRWRHLASTTSE